MVDSAGSVGGADSASGSSAASAADAARSAAEAAAKENVAEQVAEAMVDKATTSLGVDTAALAGQVAALSAQPAAQNPAAAAMAQAVAAAVEAKLSVVDAGQFRAALETASVPSAAALAATPVDLTTTPSIPSIDLCGNPVTTVSAPSWTAPGTKTLDQVVEHIDRITGAPVSGMAYTAAYLAGADQPTLDTVYNAGKVVDDMMDIRDFVYKGR